ncbi:MAG: hypothetical protein EOP22_19605 [Hyphomicrobiales bacterium]|nr:MAG: hypothetical protein EOP22_19605 [Hyphomicrobiales bacterium]
MHTFLDSKLMAKSLRAALAERHIDITHSDSLELVARQFGFDNWNILAARIEAARAMPMPHKWFRHQQGSGLYQMSVALTEPIVLTLQSQPGAIATGSDFGTLMQNADAAPYHGANLAFTAELAGDDVDHATVWMRVDAADGTILAFDNLLQSGDALTGSFDWTQLRVALPVASATVKIAYGVMLKGLGNLSVRSPRLAPVPTAGSGEAVAA